MKLFIIIIFIAIAFFLIKRFCFSASRCNKTVIKEEEIVSATPKDSWRCSHCGGVNDGGTKCNYCSKERI